MYEPNGFKGRATQVTGFVLSHMLLHDVQHARATLNEHATRLLAVIPVRRDQLVE